MFSPVALAAAATGAAAIAAALLWVTWTTRPLPLSQEDEHDKQAQLQQVLDSALAEAASWRSRCEKAEQLRLEERRGRTAAEQRLRQRDLDRDPAQTSAATAAAVSQLRPIGHVRSVFRTRNGTPRQPGLAPHGRATLQLTGLPGTMNAGDSLDGLQGYSHVWLLFVFHDNTNDNGDEMGATTAGTGTGAGAGSTMKAKVTPPRLGRRVGLFATRTPHRPHAIGLSLVKLDGVDEVRGTLRLSGVDLIDGTPVLDVKGYLPHIESIGGGVTIPAWVEDKAQQDFDMVALAQPAEDALRQLLDDGKMEFYAAGEWDVLVAMVREVLLYDMRAWHRKSANEAEHSVRLDNAKLVFVVDQAQRSVTVTSVEYQRVPKPDHHARRSLINN